jgi:hypothetical protein
MAGVVMLRKTSLPKTVKATHKSRFTAFMGNDDRGVSLLSETSNKQIINQ